MQNLVRHLFNLHVLDSVENFRACQLVSFLFTPKSRSKLEVPNLSKSLISIATSSTLLANALMDPLFCYFFWLA